MTSAKKITAYHWRHLRNINVLETQFEGRLAPFANVVAGDYFEPASIPDIFCGMYVTPTTWKEICGSRASKRSGTEGGTALCPWYGTVSWRTRLGGVCVRLCKRGKNTENSKVPFVRWYLRLSVSSNRFSCLRLVPGACEHRTGSCKISCTNRYQTVPLKDETIRQSIVRNSKRCVLSWKN